MNVTLPQSLLSAGFLLLGLSTACLAADIPASVDINLQVSNPLLTSSSKDTKHVPAFSHAKHATAILQNNSAHAGRAFDEQLTCKACHPGVASPEEVVTQATKERQAKEVTEAGSIKKYMHSLCLDCHKSLKKAALVTGPTSCSGCHNPK